MKGKLQKLSTLLQGELYDDTTMRTLYATDASAYREMPLAVAIPKTKEDIQTLIQFAKENKTNLIPRTAGTSLAGQVVGSGIIVDVSKHFTKIIELNEESLNSKVFFFQAKLFYSKTNSVQIIVFQALFIDTSLVLNGHL